MIRKIEDALEVVFVGLLTFLPLVFYVIQKITSVQVPGSEYGIAHLVFLFACMAGIITWREDRHLSLASFSGKLPPNVRGVTDEVSNGATVFVLTMLFVNAVCQLINPGQFAMTVWGIPVKVAFVFLPLCYVAMLCMVAAKKERLVSTVVGAMLGIVLSMGAITGILYYLFGFGADNVPALFAIFNGWNFIAAKCLWLFIVFFVVLAFLGVPLFVVLAGIAFVLLSMNGGYTDQIPLETYRMFTDRNIAAIPLFTIAGYILATSSAGQRYVELFKALFGWFRGGTVIAAVFVMTFFSTFSGVSGVTILALGSLLSVVLKGSGYSDSRAESLITSSGAIGLLFPPSAAIIMYGTTNYFSVDVFDLFRAAIIPGIIMMIAMIVMGVIFDRQDERAPFSLPAIGTAVVDCIPELLMPLFICIFYFIGVFDLFETSAFAVFYAYLLSTVIRRDFSFRKSLAVVAESIPISGGVLFILGAASGISYFILDANVPAIVTDAITGMVTNKYVFLILMNIVLLIVGCLMDMFSAILIVSPLLLPIAEYFGISPLHAGVIFLMNLSIGFLTPPVGMDLFISSYTFKKPLPKVIKGIVPFLLVQFAVLLLITYVPWFTSALFV